MVNVLVTGYGKVGREMTDYLQKETPHITRVIGVVEPAVNLRKLAANETRLPTYDDLSNAMNKLNPEMVIDCSSIGNGAKNLVIYKAMGIRAIVQGGEDGKVAPLYVEGHGRGKRAVRIPKCSTTTTNAVLNGLRKANIVPEKVVANYTKVMPKVDEGRGWYVPEYESGKEVEESWKILTGEKIKVIQSSRYLPGDPKGPPIYSADLTIRLKEKTTEADVKAALKRHEGVAMVSPEELDTMPYLGRKALAPRPTKVPVVKEFVPLIPVVAEDTISVEKLGDVYQLSLHVESVAPHIDLPVNVMAVIELTDDETIRNEEIF